MLVDHKHRCIQNEPDNPRPPIIPPFGQPTNLDLIIPPGWGGGYSYHLLIEPGIVGGVSGRHQSLHRLPIFLFLQEVDQITSQVDSSTIPSHVAAESALQNKYKAEMCRIMQENPNCIPIRCVRAVDCTPAYGLLEKKKFAAPKDMTLSRFNEHIRQVVPHMTSFD